MKINSGHKTIFFILTGILMFTFLIFFNSLKNDFIVNSDDEVYIINNNLIRDISFTGIRKMFSSYYGGNYHPLTALSNAIDYKISGLNPKWFHINNLILHLLNIILVFRLILLLSPGKETALIVSVLFAIHPLHVESVAWLSERKDLLYSFFFLLSLINYIHYQNSKKKIFMTAVFIFFVCSLLSKSAAVVLPVVLFTVDYFLSRKWTSIVFLEKIPFFVLSIIFGLVNISAQNSVGAMNMQSMFSLIDKLLLGCYSLIFYLFKALVPLGLSIYHVFPQKINGYLPVEYYLAPVVIVLLIGFLYKNSFLRKDIIFGFLFFLVNIFLVLKFLPFGQAVVAERYTYLPYIGLFFIIGQMHCKLSGEESNYGKTIKIIIPGVLITGILIFSALTYQRIQCWKNGLVLYSDMIQKYPAVDWGYVARGTEKLILQDYGGAIADYDSAIRLDPNYAFTYKNRALAKQRLGDYQGALEDYNFAILKNPGFAEAYNDRAFVFLLKQNRSGACADWQRAVQLGFQDANIAIQQHCQ